MQSHLINMASNDKSSRRVQKRKGSKGWYFVKKESGYKIYTSSNHQPLRSKEAEFDLVKKAFSKDDSDNIWFKFVDNKATSLQLEDFEWTKNQESRYYQHYCFDLEFFIKEFTKQTTENATITTTLSDEFSIEFDYSDNENDEDSKDTLSKRRKRKSHEFSTLMPESSNKNLPGINDNKIESCSEFLQRLQKEHKFMEKLFHIPVSKLAAPADDFMVRSIDEEFVKTLTKEFKENPIFCPDPLLCLVADVQNANQFSENNLLNYTFHTIGGNHRRRAYETLLFEKHITETTLVPVKLVFGLGRYDILKLAVQHNQKDDVRKSMTHKEKVLICREIRSTHSLRYRQKCCEVLCESEVKLENILGIAKMEKVAFDKVMQVMDLYEHFKLKGQQIKDKGVMCKASGFRDLRKMETGDAVLILDNCINMEITFPEINKKALEMKKMREVQLALMDGLGECSWEDVIKKYPSRAKWSTLERFLGKVKRGCTNADFARFINQCQSDTSEFAEKSLPSATCIKINDNNIRQLFETKKDNCLMIESGISMFIINVKEDYEDVFYSEAIRQLISLNICENREGNYYVVFAINTNGTDWLKVGSKIKDLIASSPLHAIEFIVGDDKKGSRTLCIIGSHSITSPKRFAKIESSIPKTIVAAFDVKKSDGVLLHLYNNTDDCVSNLVAAYDVIFDDTNPEAVQMLFDMARDNCIFDDMVDEPLAEEALEHSNVEL